MRFWFTPSTEVPLREQIVQQIRLGILDGQMRPGARLPYTPLRTAVWHARQHRERGLSATAAGGLGDQPPRQRHICRSRATRRADAECAGFVAGGATRCPAAAGRTRGQPHADARRATASHAGRSVATKQAPDPLSDWSNVTTLHRGSEIIVVAQTTRLCVLDHADQVALYCEHAVPAGRGLVSFVLRTDRDTIQTVLLNRTASEAAASKDNSHLGLLGGAVVGGLAGALITRHSPDGLQGLVGGAVAGAGAGWLIAAMVQRRHDHGAAVICQAPVKTSVP